MIQNSYESQSCKAAHEIIVLRYMGEMNHIATGTTPSLDGELLPPHGSSSGDEDGGDDDGEAFRGHFPVPAACRNREFYPPNLGFAMAAALEGFSSCGLFV